MTGSIQTKNNMFYAVLNCRDSNGKRKQKWIPLNLNVQGNKREAQKRLNEILISYKEELNELSEKLFCDWLNEWVEIRKNDIQLSTYDGYIHMINKHIYPYFSKLKITLQKLTADDIQYYYKEKLKMLSANTVHKHHELIHSALKFAWKKGFVNTNVADYILEIPKKEKTEISFYISNELCILINEIKNTKIEIPAMLIIWFGLRRSEVLGLKWDSINFENATLTIKRKVVRAKVNGKLQAVTCEKLKTSSSFRTYKLNPIILNYLQNVRQRQSQNEMIYGGEYNQSYKEYVCVTESGELIQPDYLSHKFESIIKKLKLKKITLHGLRHSTASYLLDKGFNMKEIQEYLGHASYQTTANIYSHISPESKKKMVNTIATEFVV